MPAALSRSTRPLHAPDPLKSTPLKHSHTVRSPDEKRFACHPDGRSIARLGLATLAACCADSTDESAAQAQGTNLPPWRRSSYRWWCSAAAPLARRRRRLGYVGLRSRAGPGEADAARRQCWLRQLQCVAARGDGGARRRAARHALHHLCAVLVPLPLRHGDALSPGRAGANRAHAGQTHSEFTELPWSQARRRLADGGSASLAAPAPGASLAALELGTYSVSCALLSVWGTCRVTAAMSEIFASTAPSSARCGRSSRGCPRGVPGEP